jgi:hypothetical protein
MLHPTGLGIRPQYIEDYLEEIAKTCPLEKIVMVCHGMEIGDGHNVLSRLTVVTGDLIVDAIHRRVPPYPLRPPVNGWLDACAKAWEAREKPTKPGRSKGGEVNFTNSQPWYQEPSLTTTVTTNEIDIDGNESLILF